LVWVLTGQDWARRTLPCVATQASRPSPTRWSRPWFARYMDFHSVEEGDSDTGDVECYCRLALDGDRASWWIVDSRERFESRMTATSRRYTDRSGDSDDRERRQQWTVDMCLSYCGKGPRKSWKYGLGLRVRIVGALRLNSNFQVRFGDVAGVAKACAAAPHILSDDSLLGLVCLAERDAQHSEYVFVHLYLSDLRHPSGSLEMPTGKA
jgi:hypothetical protein